MADLHHSSAARHEKKHGQDQTQTFNTEFPMPEPPKPNFSSSMYTSSDSVFNDYYNKPSSSRQGYMTTRSGLVFRSADSTDRALRELEMRKKESRTRNRASTLIIVLFMVAVAILNVTKSEEILTLRSASGEEEIKADGAGSTPGGNLGLAAGTDSQLESTLAALQINEVEAPPEEEVIQEGMDFLQPFRYFADLTTARRKTDSNYFFHIPRSGGQTIKDIAGRCLGKTLATEVGVREGHAADLSLQAVEVEGNHYVNVDTTSIDGLHRAANLGLAASNLSDMISSSYFGEVGMLFELEHKGRAFTILRDPMERAVSMYYHVTRGDKAYLDPSITLEDYAQGNGIENSKFKLALQCCFYNTTRTHLFSKTSF